ncbi:MAG TPA: SLC13 family permease [Thermoleophilaceae bacterium]
MAIAFVAARPRSWLGAAGAAACAALTLVTAGAAPAALAAAGPPVAFIAAVMALALLADESGLAGSLAAWLAHAGRGRSGVLFALVCVMCALLTAALSLDGAVVVMVPVVVALARRHGAPLRPLLLATVGVANSFSAALPAGNPTNLVVMERLGLSPGGFTARMLLPSLAATVACAAVLWLVERRSLARGYRAAGGSLPGGGAGAAVTIAALAAAIAADWLSPLVGVSPWLPVSVVAALALAAARRRPLIALPVRLGVQIGSLLVVVDALRAALHLGRLGIASPTLAGLAMVAAAVTFGAALANNLPASAAVAGLLSAGPGSYAALLGLSAGALATPHGSVATLVSLDMSHCHGARGLARVWAAAALAAVAAGVLLLRLTS